MIRVTPVNGTIDLGRTGEHLAREVAIPLNGIAIGTGHALLLHQRSGDHDPYPVESITQGMNLIWPVTNADTGAYGFGQAEVRWLGEDGSVIKSQVYRTITQQSLQDPGKPPEGHEGYVNAVARDAKTAKDAAADSRALYQKVQEDLAEGKLTGPKGDKGDTGPQGPQGEPGPQGPQGDSTAATAAANAAQTSAANAEAHAANAATSAAAAQAAADAMGTELRHINKDLDAISKVDNKSINVFDKNAITENARYDVFANNNTIWVNGSALMHDITNMFVTDLIPVKDGDIVRANIRWNNLAFLNENKVVARCKSGGDFGALASDNITISGDLVKYIQCTYNKTYQHNGLYDATKNALMITVNNAMPSEYEEYFAEGRVIQEDALTNILPKYISKQELSMSDKWVRKDVHIYTTDTQEEILVKMLGAIEHKNCDVYFECGTYNFDIVFDLMKSDYGYTTAYELPIGGNCRYFFNGSTLIATKTSTDSNVIGNESLMGSRRTSGNYELYDGTLIANDMVYVVHDEAQGSAIPYVRKYHNMRMKYNTIASTESIRKCIGGGSGLRGTIVIENCIFECDNLAEVSYHGFDSSDSVELNVTISNCYFAHKPQLDSMYDNGVGKAYFTGCSMSSEPVVGKNWTLINYNKEIRVN